MNEEMMTAGTGGFSGSAAATGPNAGYDPVMKFRSKVKSKKDKKLVMPGNELKAEDNRSYQEKLEGIVSERISKLKEQIKTPAAEAGAAATSGGKTPPSIKFNASGKSRFMQQQNTANANRAVFANSSSGPYSMRGANPIPTTPAKTPVASTANPAPSQGNPMQANRPGFSDVGKPKPSLSGSSGSLNPVSKVIKGAQRKNNKPSGLRSMPESAAAPQDQPVGLYQYKVTVPEMGTTIIYAASPAELMVKFRMLFNPRFIRQIKIERISPHQAGELFYVKRLKHLRNIKSD